MPTNYEKRRATQAHLDAISADSGPVYGVRLISSLPIGKGSMTQAMPSRADLQSVRGKCERVVAGYEILLAHYRDQVSETERLTALIRRVIHGNWSTTELQEAIGDLR